MKGGRAIRGIVSGLEPFSIATFFLFDWTASRACCFRDSRVPFTGDAWVLGAMKLYAIVLLSIPVETSLI